MSHPPPQLPEKAVSGGGESRLLGRWGESIAADDLRRQGWSILYTNYRCRGGEIDIIASKSGVLAFVEVKLRKTSGFAPARAFVTAEKQQKLRLTAELYLLEHPTDLQPRFDVAEVYAPQGMETAHPEINYIENAF